MFLVEWSFFGNKAEKTVPAFNILIIGWDAYNYELHGDIDVVKYLRQKHLRKIEM